MPENILLLSFTFTFIFVLSAFKKQLVFELQGISLLLFKSSKPGTFLYTLIFLPGTIIHELSHWIMAEILQVHTGEIQIFPDQKTPKKSLGSVETTKTDPFRGFFIGMAPLIIGTVLLVGLAAILGDKWSTFTNWQRATLVYAVIVLSNSMLISPSDRKFWPFMAILTIAFYWAAQQVSLNLPKGFHNFLSSTFRSINNALILSLLLELALITIFFSIRLGIEKITKKKVRRK